MAPAITLFLGHLMHLIHHVSSWDNGLAMTPPMGWANWNSYGCNYNDTTIRQQAQAMVDLELRDLGYDTLIIQECIVKPGSRDESGILQPDPEKFPLGIADLVDFIHSLDLKAGIYTDVGPETCAGYEGSFNHEMIDAQTFADWGIDFIEEDSCHHPTNYSYEELYIRMHDAIEATGRDMVFYMCVQGQDNVQQWGQSVGHLWRTTGDICAPGHATYQGMINNFHGNAKYPGITGPGHWQVEPWYMSDPDMMVVGMDGLTELEWKTQFSLWAISAAPLWIGIDLTKLKDKLDSSDSALSILKNKGVIAVDQDPLGLAAIKMDQRSSSFNEKAEIYWKILQPDKKRGEEMANAIVLFNPANATQNDIGLHFAEIGVNGPCMVQDLWAEIEPIHWENVTMFETSIPSHGVVMLRVSQ